jgi:hypothetical protein
MPHIIINRDQSVSFTEVSSSYNKLTISNQQYPDLVWCAVVGDILNKNIF